MKALVRALVLALAAVSGCIVVHAVASVVPNATEAGAHGAYLAVLRQAPIPIVQEATSWWVLATVWALFAALAALGWWFVRSLDENPSAPAAVRPRIIALSAAFALTLGILTFFPISQSIDVYYYSAYARIYGVHGINPYDLSAPLALHDPVLEQNLEPLSNPPFADSYGPGFTLLAGVVGRAVAAAPLWWQVWTWRAAAALAALLVLGALARMTSALDVRVRIARLGRFAFNPLVLYEASAGGHNDWLMVAPAIWAFAVLDDLPLIAGLLLGVAISVKYMAMIAVPFAAIRAGRTKPAAGALLLLIAAAVPLLCARPFSMGSSAEGALVAVGSQVSMSLNWLLALPFFRLGGGSSPVFSSLPALPMLGLLTWPRLIQLCILAAMGAAIVASIAMFVRRGRTGEIFRATTALLWAIPAMHPWYLAWLSPALASSSRWATFAAWYLSMGLLVYAHEGVVAGPWSDLTLGTITIALLAVPIVAARRGPAHPFASASEPG